MGAIVDYNNVDFTKLNKIINKKIIIKNIKLLETPIHISNNNLDFTLLKIVCNKNIKKLLKIIEKLYQDEDKDISIVFNYDINSNKDYYELLLNKKIKEIIENFDINQYYNIEVSLVNEEIILWKIHSIEISDNYKIKEVENDLNIAEDYEPDYEEIQNSYINEINSQIKLYNEKQLSIETKILKLENLLNEIKNNYNIRNLENYRENLENL
jgi:hypothetical protein